MSHSPIAIIGLACRFPGGENPTAFWDFLLSGQSAVQPIPPERFVLPEPHYAGLLNQVDGFDPEYFGVTPTEAASMDLQQRLMLELGVEVFQDAGLPLERLRGQKVGVFMGVSSADYTQTQLQGLDQVNMYTITGAATSVIANRLSYFFDLQGPSLVVDTACSASLTALHLAVQSLRSGQSEMTLVGGVNMLLSPLLHQGFAEAQALSPEGKCKTFDASADGMVRGEGAGLVLLKPLAQAQADQDRIYAVLWGSGLSQDGQTNGLSAPSPAGQRRSLKAACADAQIDPARVKYVEAHGTGTPLGDPIEARALGEIYGQARLQAGEPPLKIGSVKTQIGHLEAAAGIAGLIKSCLSLYHGQLPPSLHFHTPNPQIAFEKWHLQVVTQRENLSVSNLPSSFLGVSAFGFGGTNVHALLGPAPLPPAKQTPEAPGLKLLPLSAHSQAALAQRARDLGQWLKNKTHLQFRDLQYSLAQRQSQGSYRTTLVFDTLSELQSGLQQLASEAEPGIKQPKRARPKLVFLFSGMGSQEKGMGQQLLHKAVFLQRLTEVDAVLQPLTGFSVREAIQNGYSDRPEVVQPILFALQLALYAQWQAWGIQPDALIGTSMGEISAACAGGWLSLADAALIVVKRIELITRLLGTGALGIVGLSASAVAQHLASLPNIPLWIAGLNGPELTVLSGETQALETFLAKIQSQGHFARRVKGADAPSHSPLMEELKSPLFEALASIVPQAGHTPVYSTVFPAETPQSDFGPEYWWQNLRHPVQLLPVLGPRAAAGQIIVEISPHPVLTAGLLSLSDSPVLPSLRRDIPTARPMLESLGQLYAHGFSPHWPALIDTNAQLISLPPYPWQRISCWLPASEGRPQTGIETPPKSQGVSPLATRLKGENPRLAASNPPDLSRASLIAQLQQELAHALRIAPEMLNPSEPLKHLGIGSLVGMELFSRLKKKFGVKLPLAQFLQGPSLEGIADMILSSLQAETAPPKQTRPAKLPLSFAQTRFWLLEQLQPHMRTHFIPVAIEINGPLQISALQAACAAVIQRHEILRSIYRQDESGQPYQVVLENPPSAWEVIACPDLSKQDLHATLKAHARQPFDWENSPPLRFSLFVPRSENAQENDRFILLLSLHHIVADGLSFRVLFQELQAHYQALLQGKTADLPPLTWQYADFALWQRRQWEQDPSYQADLSYWQSALAGAPVQMPFPDPGPAMRLEPGTEIPGAQAPFVLPAKTYQALEQLAKASGVSLFSLLLSAFYLLLWKFCDSQDLVVGTPVAGRLESETQDLIGPFLNMLPLRQQIDPEQELHSLLQTVQNQVLQALEHQATPFEQMVEVLHPPRIQGLHPIFQAVLALHGEIGFAPLGECQLRPLELDIGVARFDLAFTLIPEQGALKGSVEYNGLRFSAETIAQLIAVWLEILASLPVLSPQMRLKDWQIPTDQTGEAEAKQGSSNHRPADKPHLLSLLAGESDTWALIDEQANPPQRWRYSELWQGARRIAQILCQTLERNPLNSPFVAVCLPRGAEAVVSWLGILLADKAYLPLDPDSPPERLRHMLASVGDPLLICNQELASALLQQGFPPAHIANLEVVPEREMPLPTPSLPLSNAIFTSGTTGQPKAVQVTHAGMVQLIQWHLNTFATQVAEPIPQTAQISFDAAGWEIWSTLAAGATLLFWPRPTLLDPLALQQASLQADIRQLFLPTPLAAQLLALDWPANTPLRTLRTGGDRLPPFAPHKLPFLVWNHYGPSECSVVALAGPITHLNPGEPPGLGQLLPGLQAKICDPLGHRLPAGFPGQLALSGIGLSPGYISMPGDETQPTPFQTVGQDTWYWTGDRAVYRQGQWHFLGRVDRQFKWNGIRLEPAEIENVLLRHPDIENAAVLPGQYHIWAFFTGKVSPLDLNSWLKTQLPPSLIPAQLCQLSDLPLTSRGKVDSAALQARIAQAEAQANTPPAKAQNPLEEQIASLWQALLGPGQMGHALSHDTDFFAAGGHSLLAVQMVMQLRQKTGREIHLAQLFAHSRLGDFCQAVAATPYSQAPLPLLLPDPTQAYAPFELTPVQAAYWLGRQQGMQWGGVGAQIYLELSVPQVDPVRLETALNRLIQRHAMLQTVITAQGQQQRLASLPIYALEVKDLRQAPAEVQAEALSALRQKNLAAVFDPLQWPLFELSLTQHSGGQRLHLRLDALMADASSFLRLGQELEIYIQNPEAGLPPLEVAFSDYQRSLGELRQGPAYFKARDYWQSRLDSLPEPPQLPQQAFQEREFSSPPRFARLSLEMEISAWQALKNRAAEHQLTPNGLVLALFAAVLGCWSENESFLLNLTTFQRLPLHPHIDQVVGDFTNLNLLAIGPRQGNWIEWTRLIQAQLWQDLEHSLYSGVEVLRDLRQHGHSGTAPVVFTGLLGQPLPPLPLGATLEFAQTQTPQVWLDCQASENDQGLQLNWDYLVDLFPADLIPMLFKNLEQLLHRLANDPEAWVNPLSLTEILGPTVSDARLAANQTAQPIPAQGLHTAAILWGLAHPETPALSSPERNLSYAELLAEAHALAQQLRVAGLRQAEPVAILMHKGWEQAVAVLGVLLAGGAYLPIEAHLPPERIRALLNLGQCRFAFTQPGFHCEVQQTQIPVRPPTAPLPLPHEAEFQACLATVRPEQLAYIIFTSGSTGTPKGVMISHAAAWNTVAAVNRLLGLQSDDRVWGLSSLSFDLSVYDLFGTWAAGACLVLPPPHASREPDQWLQPLLEHKITLWNSVPALLQLLLEYLQRSPDTRFPALRQVLLSGDWIPLELPERIRARAPQAQVWSLGGATEASIWSNFHKIALPLAVDWSSIPYGKPLPNQQFEVFNPDWEPCPDWASGELCIAGTGLALGYWQDPEKTAERFVTHPKTGIRWYRTGDRGRYRPGGLLEFLGRRDNQVKIQGYRIELGEIESHLRTHPAVADALVTAPLEAGKRDQRRLCAYYVHREPISAEALESYLASRLPAWMVPHQWLAMEAFPLNSSGKPDRKALPPICATAPLISDSQSQQEAHLSAIFKEVLALEIQDPEVDLLSLGVNSIDLIRLGNRLQTEFGFAPGVGELFQLRNLRQLAQYFQEQSRSVVPTQILAPSEQKIRPKRTAGGPETPLGQKQAPAASENWKSTRQFLPQALELHQLANLLGVLASFENRQETLRFLYPSAGGVYPLWVYLQIAPERVNGLEAGLYLYQPQTHSLQALQAHGPAYAELHFPNSLAMAESSAFSLYLVADIAAMQAHYGSDARDYCLIEAGAMLQLLREAAPQTGLGLCSVSQVNATLLRGPCGWQSEDQCLHSLVGGIPAPNFGNALSAQTERVEQIPEQAEEWEEWVF